MKSIDAPLHKSISCQCVARARERARERERQRERERESESDSERKRERGGDSSTKGVEEAIKGGGMSRSTWPDTRDGFREKTSRS